MKKENKHVILDTPVLTFVGLIGGLVLGIAIDSVIVPTVAGMLIGLGLGLLIDYSNKDDGIK